MAAAFALFSERGFAATRIEDVAARAGIAKGTVYLHFPDKEALFISLASSIASPILGRLEAMAAAADAIPARQSFTVFSAWWTRKCCKRNGGICCG